MPSNTLDCGRISEKRGELFSMNGAEFCVDLIEGCDLVLVLRRFGACNAPRGKILLNLSNLSS